MALTIEQQPLYNTLPVGQDIMFTLKEDVIVATKYNVKFVAYIYIDDGVGSFTIPTNLVATLKVTPNNRGVGIFSLNSILESYVEPQQEGVDLIASISQFQGNYYSTDNPHPIHIIDKLCCNKKVAKYFQIGFNIEYTDLLNSTIVNTLQSNLNSEQYLFFNGVLDEDEVLKFQNKNYGYNLNFKKLVMNSNQCNFLTNAPTTQYARLTDYGTFSFLNFLNVSTNSFQVGTDDAVINMVKYILIRLYDSSGTQLGSYIQIDSIGANGGFNINNPSAHTRIMFAGVFPANLDGAAYSTWVTHRANVSYYTISATDDQDEVISQDYTIKIIDNPCKGYEAIRLTWLNQYGTWDYYTFNKKSIKSLQTNRTSYTQQSGTWNGETFRINGYKGGKKNFRVNSKQLITVNTDFLIESEAVWFENLINSTEVYMLNGYDTYSNIANYGMTNKFVTPVSLTTSNYVTKTKANNKLIQYTFDLEKTYNKRTQTV